MSLATLLDRLTGLLPKYFVIAAFLPALVFGFLNGVILYHHAEGFRKWSPSLISGTPGVFASAAVLIGLAVAAYLLSSVNGFLREVLEGKHFLRRWEGLRSRFEARQRERFSEIVNEYYKARDEGARISKSKREWRETLSKAAVEGTSLTEANNYSGKDEPAAKDIEKLRELRKNAKTIPFADLAGAVQSLRDQLSVHNIRKPNAASGLNRLSEDRQDLLSLMDYAEDSWAARELQRFHERSRFGVGAIAPTTMGNIAASMQGYGITRYGINLETFWTRLQPILAANNKDFYGSLQDSKTQLDFLVACCWLSVFSSGTWLPILVITAAPWWLFVAVALVGPLAAWLCYALAIESYVVFTELVRTSLDLYRFPLLRALHIALPAGIRDERATWNALQRLSTYGEEWVDLSYQHDSKGGSA